MVAVTVEMGVSAVVEGGIAVWSAAGVEGFGKFAVGGGVCVAVAVKANGVVVGFKTPQEVINTASMIKPGKRLGFCEECELWFPWAFIQTVLASRRAKFLTGLVGTCP